MNWGLILWFLVAVIASVVWQNWRRANVVDSEDVARRSESMVAAILAGNRAAAADAALPLRERAMITPYFPQHEFFFRGLRHEPESLVAVLRNNPGSLPVWSVSGGQLVLELGSRLGIKYIDGSIRWIRSEDELSEVALPLIGINGESATNTEELRQVFLSNGRKQTILTPIGVGPRGGPRVKISTIYKDGSVVSGRAACAYQLMANFADANTESDRSGIGVVIKVGIDAEGDLLFTVEPQLIVRLDAETELRPSGMDELADELPVHTEALRAWFARQEKPIFARISLEEMLSD